MYLWEGELSFEGEHIVGTVGVKGVGAGVERQGLDAVLSDLKVKNCKVICIFLQWHPRKSKTEDFTKYMIPLNLCNTWAVV